ncbi:MAG: DeoR/GlpR family DNA-binding transcription regulator [Bacteroidota bacterium]
MLKEERLTYILNSLRLDHKVLTAELSGQLNVSEDTIRRDLKELSDNGKIKKVHGGAVAHSLNPFSYRERKVYKLQDKITIVEKAISLIQNGQVIIMDGGTTNLELARRLPEDLAATIFTNSLPVAEQLAEHPTVDIIFAGGKLLKSALATIGLEVIQSFSEIRADLGILGTRSVDREGGITEIDWEEAKVKRAIVSASQHLISLAISEKLDTLQPYKVADISHLHTLVTELPSDSQALAPYKELGIHIR